MKGQRQLYHRRRGSTLVEAAMVVPIMLLLAGGIVQYGLIYNATNAVTQTAREGARVAAVHGNKVTANKPGAGMTADEFIVSRMRLTASNAGLNPDHMTFSITPPMGSRYRYDTQINVSVTYDLRRKMFLPFVTRGISPFYTRTSSMMVEQGPASP